MAAACGEWLACWRLAGGGGAVAAVVCGFGAVAAGRWTVADGAAVVAAGIVFAVAYVAVGAEWAVGAAAAAAVGAAAAVVAAASRMDDSGAARLAFVATDPIGRGEPARWAAVAENGK